MDRRKMLIATGIAGLGVGAVALGSAQPASAAEAAAAAPAISDGSVLNFALNLEYLEAEFYLRATTGAGLSNDLIGANAGAVTGGKKVEFKTKRFRQFAEEIAGDERAHVKFLRDNLKGAAVSRPVIDLDASFTAAATAAGVIKPGQKFDPFADEQSFLLGAFIFEDVGVTAYKGAAPFITNKVYLEAAAGILAVEAYHAGIIRSELFELGLSTPAHLISGARDSLDGTSDIDHGLYASDGVSNIIPTDANGIAYSRTPGQVLNIVFLNNKSVKSGGFFPKGIAGDFTTSDAN